MTEAKLIRILDQHSIEHHERNGRVYAVEVWTDNGEVHTKEINVTNWSIKRLACWLGY